MLGKERALEIPAKPIRLIMKDQVEKGSFQEIS